MVNKENGQEQILSFEQKEQMAQNKEFQRALGNGDAGDFVRPELAVKKVVFNINSDILYILTANTSEVSPRHSNIIFALNISNLEINI